ncbi:MAG: O-antigen ligase family protein, partial [Desulfobacterales bacterium]
FSKIEPIHWPVHCSLFTVHFFYTRIARQRTQQQCPSLDRKMAKITEKTVFAGIIFLIMFAPLAFGAVHVWAYSFVEIVIFALAALYALGKICEKGKKEFTWVKTPIGLLLAGIPAIIALQLVPMPLSWMEAISPNTAALKSHAAAIVEKINEVENSNLKAESPNGSPSTNRSLFTVHRSQSNPSPITHKPSPITHNVHGTLRQALKLLAYLTLFFLVLNTVNTKRRMDILLLAVIAMGLFEALYAVSQVFSLSPRVLWWQSRAGGGRYASGTFIGSNHFAGYMEMTLCMAWGYVLTLKKKTTRMEAGLGGARARFQRLLGRFSPESAAPLKIVFVAAAVVMGVALLLSASRGGILSISMAMLVMAGLFLSRKKQAGIGLMSLAFCLFTFVYGLSVGIDPTLEKFEKTQGLNGRIALSRSLIPMLMDYPVTGVGWGNNPDLFAQYEPGGRAADYYNGNPHNDWLEAGTELGLPGLALMLAAFFVLFVRMARVWRRRRNAYAVGVTAGALAAMVAIGLHSLVDFNMHTPANPLTLAVVLGLGFVALHHRGHGYGVTFFYRTARVPLPKRIKPAVCLAVIAGAGALMWAAGAHWAAEAACATEKNSTFNLNRDLAPADIERAMARNPLNAEYPYRLAVHHLQAAQGSGGDADAAVSLLKTAVMNNPARGKYWHALAAACRSRDDDLYRYLRVWIPLADECHDTAVFLSPRDGTILAGASRYWVWRAGLLPEEAAAGGSAALTREAGIAKFQGLFRRYLALRPYRWKRCVDFVSGYFGDHGVVLGILPVEDLELRGRVVRYLVKKGEQ